MRGGFIRFFAVVLLITLFFLLYSHSNNFSGEKRFKYVGVEVCAMCHSGEEIGNQYEIWQKSMHSKAFVTLASDRALEQARDAGVKEHPQDSPRCLKCHVPGVGLDSTYFAETFKKEEGVTCEVCHGPGSEYIDASIMEDREKFLENGGIIPDEKTCLKCHSDPFFTFEEKYREIAHPLPPKK